MGRKNLKMGGGLYLQRHYGIALGTVPVLPPFDRFSWSHVMATITNHLFRLGMCLTVPTV